MKSYGIKNNKIYVVTAYKWGDRENHSYTCGVFGLKDSAIKCAEMQADYRGGKYSCHVEEFELNWLGDDCDMKTIYNAKGREL